MSTDPPKPSCERTLGSSSQFEVAKLDSEKMRSSVAAKLFGGEAEPVRIGPYTVLRRLGAGGMGVVYSAYDERLDRKIAVKVLHGRAVLSVQEDRLAREARALAKLSHPNVVQVFEVGNFRGQVYLAMEFIPGQTLKTIKRQPKRSLAEQLQPWIQAGKGLLAAHKAGLVHRDFKPENAMRMPCGLVKVFDFGLAMDINPQDESDAAPASTLENSSLLTASVTNQDHPSQGRSTMSMTGALVGTPAYMAPEQHLGQKASPRSDQFSFCVALWEFFHGQLPFAGSTPAEVVQAMREGKLRSSNAPSWLARALSRGFSFDPANRHPSMQDLLDRIEKGLARKKKAIVAGAFALPVAMSAAFSLGSASVPDPCQGLATHWDKLAPEITLQPSKRQIDDNPRGWAQATFGRVVQDLQTYVKQGKAQHIAACQAAIKEQRAGHADFSAQSSCYLAAADAVSAFAKRLQAASQKELRPALWLSANLPPLSACDEGTQRSEVPVDQAKRDQLEKTLARAQVEIAFHGFEKARSLAQEVVQSATHPGLVRLKTRALLIQAQANRQLGSLADAKRCVNDAYRLAERIADPALRLQAAVSRARLFLHQGDLAAFHSQLRDAYPLAQRKDIHPERRVRYFALACHTARGDYDLCEAHRNCIEGLELIKDKPGSTPERNPLYRSLSWLYLEAGLLQKSIEISNQSRADLRRAVGESSVLMLASEMHHLTVLGEQVRRSGKDKQRLDELLPQVRSLHQRYVDAYGPNSGRVIPVRTNLAELLRWAGHLEEAKPLFESLLREHPKDPDRYFTLVAYGQLQIAMGQTKAGLKTLREGLHEIDEVQARSKSAGADAMIPEQGEALFAIALALGPNKEGIKAARAAKAAYAAIAALYKPNKPGKDCPGLSGGQDPYALEREAVNAWLAMHDKA